MAKSSWRKWHFFLHLIILALNQKEKEKTGSNSHLPFAVNGSDGQRLCVLSCGRRPLDGQVSSRVGANEERDEKTQNYLKI